MGTAKLYYVYREGPQGPADPVVVGPDRIVYSASKALRHVLGSEESEFLEYCDDNGWDVGPAHDRFVNEEDYV
jgi:hypothetical protein